MGSWPYIIHVQVLEKDLMTERHSSEALLQETIALKAAAALFKKEAKEERRLQRADISDDHTDDDLCNLGRESNSYSEADYLTDDTARASDDEVDDDDVKSRESTLDRFSLEAVPLIQKNAAPCFDFIPAEKND